ncbi:MAG: hypothetical protein HYV96_19535 [Opitutae bacterium]|nr:hypothetical protein [Opitutae bacterium]
MTLAFWIALVTQSVIPVTLGVYLWRIGTGRCDLSEKTEEQRTLIAKWSRAISILGILCALSGVAAAGFLLFE